VRVYADTSFLVKLISSEAGGEIARSEYRRLGLPKLFYLPLHALEVENAVRLQSFHLRRTLASRERGQLTREKLASLSRLQQSLERGLFIEVSADWDRAIDRARTLSEEHSERIGTRSLDLLHVAFALELESELFLICDEQQGTLAEAEGLKVVSLDD
jgi:hypothetical protein